MDRYIPCRTRENLQAKFEAASQNQADHWNRKNLKQLEKQNITLQYQNIFGGVSQIEQ